MIKAIYDPEMDLTYVIDEYDTRTDTIGYYFGEPDEATTAETVEQFIANH